MTSVMWFRRDLRLSDNPALLAALAGAADTQVVPLFVLDPALSRPAGAARRAYLEASLTDLGMRVGGLQLRRGDPVREVAEVARAARASAVHVAEDFGPTGGSATSMSRLSSRAMAYPWCAPGRRMPWHLVGSSTRPAVTTRCSRPTPELGVITAGARHWSRLARSTGCDR